MVNKKLKLNKKKLNHERKIETLEIEIERLKTELEKEKLKNKRLEKRRLKEKKLKDRKLERFQKKLEKNKKKNIKFTFSDDYFSYEPDIKIKEVETAFESRLKTYMISNNINIKDPEKFLDFVKDTILNEIREHLKIHKSLKVNLKFYCSFKKISSNKESITENNFKTTNKVIYKNDDLDRYYVNEKKKLLAELSEFEQKDSGWSLFSINGLELRINKYIAFKGGSYIDLPSWIKNKKAIINVQNEDNKCFMWSLLSFLYPVDKNPQRISKYKDYVKIVEKLYFEEINFPISFKDIPKFEKKSNISVNIYSFEEDEDVIYPLYSSKNKQEKHINLLYFQEADKSHYCWIKDLSRLIGSQINKKDHKKYICDRCLLFFKSEEILKEHEINCQQNDAVKVIMPNESDKIKFKNYQHTMKIPFVIYADFECFCKKIYSCTPSNDESFTIKYQHHEPSGFCYYIKYIHSEYKEPVLYRGPNAAKEFIKRIKEEVDKIEEKYDQIKDMLPLSDSEIYEYNNAKKCKLCECKFTKKNIKVHHHDHLNGKYISPLCNECNLKLQKPSFVPIFFHNLSGYDSHLFVKELGYDDNKIDLIPNNDEKYISYSKHTSTNKKYYESFKMRFVDSFKFMSSSLDKLVNNLTEKQKTITKKYFKNEKQFSLVSKKGIYPYDYIDSWDKFNETNLPPKSEFYSKLKDSDINDEEYLHAKEVWKEFNLNNLGEYHDLYLKTDVLLLADVFENFRNTCINAYNLDPTWYFTAPGLSWDSMLKYTKIELDLITDYNMLLMIEKGIRGGISQCCKKYVKANNKYIKSYDKMKDSNYIMYLDANNLYGWAMSQYMPYSDIKWGDINIDLNLADDSEYGYIAEVDLEYPEKLHDLHKDFPLAPEKGESKLLTTLYNKEKYVVHYKSLKQYLSLGLKLKKVHRVITFKQSDWLKNYIDLNTEMRKKSTNDFEKDFYKLMNCAVFGKTMENIRNRVDIKLISDVKKLDKLISKPNFKHRTIFAENLVGIHMNKTKIKFNKPIYIGLSILDISKILMYDFHYNVMKKKYNDSIELLYQDTDSLLYNIKTDDIYNDMSKMIDYFDTSDYPENNQYNISRVNKKVLGKFKDEMNGKIILEFVGLRAKAYAFKTEDSKEYKKAKGVKKYVIKNNISFKDYKKALNDNKILYKEMNSIRSEKHEIYSITQNKISLNPKDDKRYILDDRINTIPFGHYSIGN